MKPVILVVDDEPEAQQAIERDLRVKYSHQFEVLIAMQFIHHYLSGVK